MVSPKVPFLIWTYIPIKLHCSSPATLPNCVFYRSSSCPSVLTAASFSIGLTFSWNITKPVSDLYILVIFVSFRYLPYCLEACVKPAENTPPSRTIMALPSILETLSGHPGCSSLPPRVLILIRQCKANLLLYHPWTLYSQSQAPCIYSYTFKCFMDNIMKKIQCISFI